MQKFVRRLAPAFLLTLLPVAVRPQSPVGAPNESPLLPAPPTTEELKRALATAEIDKKQLSAELAAAWKETEQAKTEAAATQKRADAAIKKNLADQAGRVTELQQQVQALQGERAQLQLQLTELKSRPFPTPSPAIAKRPTDELQVKLASALRSYSVVEQENSRLKMELAAKTAEATKLTSEYNSLHTAILTMPTPTPSPVEVVPTPTPVDDRLATALHSYSLLQEENEKLRAQNARLQSEQSTLAARLTEAQTSLQAATPLAAQTTALRDQLRQTQDQSAAFAEENLRLRTQLSLSGSGHSAAALVPQPMVTTVDVAPTPTPTPVVPAAATRGGSSSAISAPAGDAAPRTHVIAAGDTLSKISLAYYGTTNRWASILAANRDVLKDEKSLTVGRTLRIP